MDRVRRRVAFRRCLLAVALGSLSWGTSSTWEAAHGQLRTGRNGAREFYPDAGSPPPSRRVASHQAASRKVIPASHSQESIITEEPSESVDSVSPVEDGEIVYEEASLDDGHEHGTMDSCGACGCTDGGCGCDGIPHINIRLAFPFARAFERLSVRMEAATFWGSDQTIPALVRTATVGTAGSTDLFGGTVAMDETVQGYRGEVGWRLGNDQCTSIQVRFFDASAQSLTFNSAGSSFPSIVRPYFDADLEEQNSISIREPGVSDGDVLAHATSDVSGGDLLLKQLVHRSCYGKLDLLVGYQTALLTDSIAVNSTTEAIDTGDSLLLQDRFDTSNRFHGGVIGLSGITYSPRWSLSGMFKLGMGNLDRYVGIDGFQEITVGPPPVSSPTEEGLLARATNIGMYQLDTFIVSPEVNVTIGYRLTRRLEATIGYNYLLLPKVARAADQIDPELAANLSNPLTGDPRPRFVFTESDFNLHSLNYGLQYRY
ncbi:MAG: BBP7 family outer membrane beta-barrel protein [Pirellula sp.]|nr:BBP7 family outer membrane beta-barrel protein [Pirellula sp.]